MSMAKDFKLMTEQYNKICEQFNSYDQLVAQYGKTLVDKAINELEKTHGDNGRDAFYSGMIDLEPIIQNLTTPDYVNTDKGVDPELDNFLQIWDAHGLNTALHRVDADLIKNDIKREAINNMYQTQKRFENIFKEDLINIGLY